METNGALAWTDTPAGKQLQERLNSEKTLRSLDHLLARIDTLENAVDRLSDLMEKAPGMISIATDMADEAHKRAAANGIYLEKRLGAALQLAERLTAPETVEKINGLLDTLDKAPNMLSMAVDAVDEQARQACERGVNIDKRLGVALRMAETITDPQMEARFNQLVHLSNQAPGLIAMAIDVLDEGYRKAVQEGLDLETLVQQGVFALKQMTELLSSSEFRALMESGVLSPSTLKIVSQAGEALNASQKEEAAKVGLFGAMRALKDPDRKRAMGFLLSFMKNFGKNL